MKCNIIGVLTIVLPYFLSFLVFFIKYYTNKQILKNTVIICDYMNLCSSKILYK